MEGTNGSSSSESDSLDHALLESLFYNEMLMMENPEEEPVAPDLALLSSPASPNVAAAPPLSEPLGGMSHNNALPPQPVNNISYESSMNGGGAPNAMPAAAAHPAEGVAQPSWAPMSSIAPTAAAMPQQQQAVAPPVAAASMPPPPPVSEVPQERAQQLVSQFATLASRLGISLPPNVLSSLTVAAAANEAQNNNNNGVAPPPMTVASNPTIVSNDPPKLQQLESTAEAAIAAVNETRKRKQHETTTTSNRPLYSKRRKKPRLSDCEAKLKALKNENAMLKRHLANVTNKAHVFDQERAQATLKMKEMLHQGAPPAKLNPLLAKFSEMYSDYGRHRHDELTFHLDQLEKLVAPTTFTKMGLWTLGQSEGFYTNPKRNPIAGILRKELNITPVQGRKIIEQRIRIKQVCDNLKQCLVLLGKLKCICEHKQTIFHERMTKCQEILTPIQVVKLLLWVDEHSHVLESVCPGWGSEQIHKKPKAK